ncbi:MAG: GGDEF domain-containing protein [Roseiarcus sp.]|jgi:diguanylate cyclase (GGDEF)-like protein
MTFDVSTLAFAEGFVSFAGGLILLITWWQDRAAWAAFWWASANCGAGVGVTLLALHAVLPAYASTIIGPLILDLCAVLAWVAAGIFNRGRIRPYPVLAGAAAWIALLILTGAYASGQLAVALGWGISGCLYGAAAIEFWLGRNEKLRGRWPMIFLLGLMAIALFLLTIEFSFSTLALPMASISWLGIIHFVTLIYAVGSAAFLVMMLRGRSEAKHRAAALIDPLTGLPNQRAFMERAERMFDRTGRDEIPISLLAFDLDRFKSINDAFGHPTGDQVLRIFADVLSRALRPADMAARIGGEEFALALPGCGDQAALAIARRIRDTFQDDARFLNGRRLDATVSVGVATAPERGCSLDDIIASADGALYRAKGLGRNHVMAAESNSRDPPASVVTRIA